MNWIRKFFNQPDFGTLLLRAFAGASMAYAHGLGKLPPSQKLIDSVGALGFPEPTIFAWAAALSEFLGGALIVFGLFTRPAAFFLAFTMAVAAFRVHMDDAFQVKEMALLYFFISLHLFFNGAGKYSIDHLWRNR